ncbi:MAG: GNAT family N-acetyltransferase [Anaerolineae bacterium]|nr:GNAT family N-acetyltransferase [Anaerolineae bacterium]MDQ7035861.1 GNAT family N-acetyltransferase [Anaerolineae bacterium]
MLSKTENPSKISITNTRLEHGEQIHHVIRAAFEVPEDDTCRECIGREAIASMLQRFAEGQFVAVINEVNDSEEEIVVGVACTMRTNYPPTKPPRAWWETIGTHHIHNHHPDGEWLYGVEMAVHPTYRKRGIGTMLYEARFDLVKRLNLRGWYAGGMLMGYHRYEDQMSVREYGEKVIAGDMKDPTVTMQMNRGFEAWSVIEDYIEEELAGDAAVLIVWKNPDYQEQAPPPRRRK